MMGAIMLPDTPLGFYAIEFSPLYIGSPAFFNDTTPPIGGGFVDPIVAAAQTACFAAFEGSILCYFVLILYCIDVLHQVPSLVFVDPIGGCSVGHQSNMLRCLYRQCSLLVGMHCCTPHVQHHICPWTKIQVVVHCCHCCLQCAGFNSPPSEPKPTLPSAILQAFAATAANVTGFNNGSLHTNSSAPVANRTAGNNSSTSSAGNSTVGYGTSGGLMQLQPLNVMATPTYVVPLKVILC
jgi:hypothetical protein